MRDWVVVLIILPLPLAVAYGAVALMVWVFGR
jgi:hypothetical protein